MKVALLLLTAALWTCCVSYHEDHQGRFGYLFIADPQDGKNSSKSSPPKFSPPKSSPKKSSNNSSMESSMETSEESSQETSEESSQESSEESEEDTLIDPPFGYFSFNTTHVCLKEEYFWLLCNGGYVCIAHQGLIDNWSWRIHKCNWWRRGVLVTPTDATDIIVDTNNKDSPIK